MGTNSSYIWDEQGNEKFQIRKHLILLIPSRWKACLDGDLLSTDKSILHTIGIHPKIAGNQVGQHLKELKRRIPGNFIAIGECGLYVSQGGKGFEGANKGSTGAVGVYQR